MIATRYAEISRQIELVNPIEYGKTRNFLNGAVTRLSPYISRGVISTKQIAQSVLARGYKTYEIEIFLKELAWRDYFQQVWIALGDKINGDLKQSQPKVSNHQISSNLVEHQTGITAIDNGINELYETGYMHNHVRMYTASLCCNVAESHWKHPAQWMYYYLLDADWASNALSWQWTAGSFSSKKYYANQENINKFCHTRQRNTFLDVSYENIENIGIPDDLKNLIILDLKTKLPESDTLSIHPDLPTVVYNFYNLDCHWLKDIKANRILLFEPGFFKQYPVCDNTINFILDLAKNIENIQLFVGEFNELFNQVNSGQIHYKEHPTTLHYKGIQHSRDWMFDEVKGYFPSFFSYWKKCHKSLSKLNQ